MKNRGQQLLRDVEFLRAAQVAEIADVNPNTLKTWVAGGGLEIEDKRASGWTNYTLRDLLRVAAWAEINDVGIAPGKASELVKQIESDLMVLAFDERDLDLKEGRFVTARSTGTSHVGAVGVATRKGLLHKFASDQDERIGTGCTTVAVNTGLLWKRITDRAAKVLGEGAK